MTLREAETWAATTLRGREDLSSRAVPDARQLLEIAAGLTRVEVLSRPDTLLLPAQEQHLRDLVTRRLRAEPLQYLRGSQEFYGRSFLVTPDVLIPRPETEDIVTAVLEATPDRSTPLRIADVGTGTAILAVTLALELPHSTVTGFDVSDKALNVAERNVQQHGASNRVRLVQSDLLSAAAEQERFDVIVSNPPYVPLSDLPSLHPEVRDYEPHLALFAGEDGQDIFRRLVPQACTHLRPGGLLVLETGGRTDILEQLLQPCFHARSTRADLQGIPRILSATRNAAAV